MKELKDLTSEQREEREILIIAMSTSMYDTVRRDFKAFTDSAGFVELYLLMQKICDRLLLSEDSEFFKSYEYEGGDGSYYQDKHNNCWDWYWMDRATKEIKKELEGWETDYRSKWVKNELLDDIAYLIGEDGLNIDCDILAVMLDEREKSKVKKFKVKAEVTTIIYTEVEATSEEDACRKASNIDGGEWVEENKMDGAFSISNAVKIN